MGKQKDLGQVWTPEWTVEKILDEVGFAADDDIVGKKILEPSFGEGVFLKEITRRLVGAARAGGLSDNDVARCVDDSVHGVEYDGALFADTVAALREWCADELGVAANFPNLVEGDALDYANFHFFDFVVGNPPYIRIHNIPDDTRERMKAYKHSTGTSDLYMIFYELGVKWLNSGGVLGFIAPNSWTRNASQKKFRKEVADKKLLAKIIDFGSVKVFPGVATYTNITVLRKKNEQDAFRFVSMASETQEAFALDIDYAFLAGRSEDGFTFVSDDDYVTLSRHQGDTGTKLGGVCKIQNGLATLADKCFLVSKDAAFAPSPHLLPAVKASTHKGGAPTTNMIFPYEKTKSGSYAGLSEEALSGANPEIYAHLLANKEKLTSRSLDKNSLWFWYGRSQAIQETGKRKLVFSHIVAPDQKKVSAYIVPADTLVYSGLFITETDPIYPLETLVGVIESEEFAIYCKLVGKDMSGGYKSVGAPAVKAFTLHSVES